MPDPIGPLNELQTKQREIMGGVYYRSALESNMQGRLVEEAKLVRADLEKSLGQIVTLLTPPAGVKTAIAEGIVVLNGEKRLGGRQGKGRKGL